VHASIFTHTQLHLYPRLAAPQVIDNPEMHEELLAAIKKKDFDAVVELVKKVNVAATDKYAVMMQKSPPIALGNESCVNHDSDVVRMIQILAEAGADANLPTCNGVFLLEENFEHQKDDIVEVLVAAGAKPRSLHTAYLLGDVPAIEAFLKRGDDPNKILDELGAPLHTQPLVVSLSAIEALEKGGADLNLYSYGTTPFIDAACFNQLQLMDALAKAGADVTKCSSGGHSPVLMAALQGANASTFQALVKLGADLNQPDNSGNTPIWAAISRFADENLTSSTYDGDRIMRGIIALAQAGADVTHANQDGKCILYFLTDHPARKNVSDVEKCIEALVKAGATPVNDNPEIQMENHKKSFEEFTSGKYMTVKDLGFSAKQISSRSKVEIVKFYDFFDGIANEEMWCSANGSAFFDAESPSLPPLCSAAQAGDVSAILSLTKDDKSKSFLNQIDR
jgi:ankyrin repeat protein